MTAALGLKTIFRSISNRELLREVIIKAAPSLKFDWKTPLSQLPDRLFEACRELRGRAVNEHADLTCALQEICDVCNDRKAAERIVDAIRDEQLLARFRKEVGANRHELQNAAAWVSLRAPDIWEHLLIAARAVKINAKQWDVFATPKAKPCGNNKQRIATFAEAVSHYLVAETLHGEHIHIECDELKNVDRYVASINNFPSNVQQFDSQGRYSIGRDANAVNFAVEYDYSKHSFRMKCPLDSPKRRVLARFFAEHILQTTIENDHPIVIDLTPQLTERILPLPNHPRIVNVRRVGIGFSFQAKHGEIDTCLLTTHGSTDLNARIEAIVPILGVPLSSIRVDEVIYEITMRLIGHPTHRIKATIRPDGFHYVCRDSADREIVRAYLEEVVK